MDIPMFSVQLSSVPYLTVVRTYGKHSRRMLHDEKIVKKRLNNPILWRQLEAITNGSKVNHLGKNTQFKRGSQYG